MIHNKPQYLTPKCATLLYMLKVADFMIPQLIKGERERCFVWNLDRVDTQHCFIQSKETH